MLLISSKFNLGMKYSCPKVFDVNDDEQQVDVTHDDQQVSKFGEQFHLYTNLREDVFVGQKFADIDINVYFSYLPISICQRMAKKGLLELIPMMLRIGGTEHNSRCISS